MTLALVVGCSRGEPQSVVTSGGARFDGWTARELGACSDVTAAARATAPGRRPPPRPAARMTLPCSARFKLPPTAKKFNLKVETFLYNLESNDSLFAFRRLETMVGSSVRVTCKPSRWLQPYTTLVLELRALDHHQKQLEPLKLEPPAKVVKPGVSNFDSASAWVSLFSRSSLCGRSWVDSRRASTARTAPFSGRQRGSLLRRGLCLKQLIVAFGRLESVTRSMAFVTGQAEGGETWKKPQLTIDTTPPVHNPHFARGVQSGKPLTSFLSFFYPPHPFLLNGGLCGLCRPARGAVVPTPGQSLCASR